MSEKYFYDKFFQTLIELHEEIQFEQWPASVGPNGKKPADDWKDFKQFINFFVGIYVKYIYLMGKIEDAYDQIIHVQIRAMVKKFLENILCRLIKVKGEIIYYTNPIIDLKPCHYVFLDEYLIDLKLEPSDLEISIPRYFREDNSDKMKERRILLEEGLKRVNNGKILEEEDKTKFFYHVDLQFEEAVSILQNFEICRQNIKRISAQLKFASKKNEEQSGNNQVLVGDEKRAMILKHLIAIQKVKQIREDELKFLKMKKNSIEEAAIIPALNSIGANPTEKEEQFMNLKSPQEVRKDRKEIQKEKERDYEKYLSDMENSIKVIEGYDMREKMINERRDWMEKYKRDNNGTPPQLIQSYYDQFKVTLQEELDDNQKKEKDKIAKDKLKKEQDKKKKDEQGDMIKIKPYTGPSGVEMGNIQKYITDFKALFETPSEFINQKDDFMENLARTGVLEKVTEAIRLEVDQMISVEMANRRTIFLKGKKDKKPKVPKVKVPPEKFCTGEKPLAKVPLSELFNELIDKQVIRNMVPHTLDELICDFNYIAHRLNIAEESLIDVPLFYTKQLIKEYCIFPLGSQFVKSNYGLNVASVLFHGPPGTGKTLAALACAYHTDALFIDISPKNVDGKIGTKEELSRTLASAFRIAKNYQPAIIYFDHAEQILPGKVKKAKGFVKNPQAQKMKKYILSMKNLITQDMRVLIIGSTNQGQYLNKKDFKNIFDKSFYFGLPSYSDRVKLWKEKIAEKTDQGDSLDYSVLGEMSNGYSHESIIECINYTLSRQRMDRVKFNPLQTDEFISSLAKTEYFYQDDYVKEKEFLNFASGMQDIYDLLNKKREENEKNSKKR